MSLFMFKRAEMSKMRTNEKLDVIKSINFIPNYIVFTSFNLVLIYPE